LAIASRIGQLDLAALEALAHPGALRGNERGLHAVLVARSQSDGLITGVFEQLEDRPQIIVFEQVVSQASEARTAA
jgi:hypothetical protein